MSEKSISFDTTIEIDASLGWQLENGKHYVAWLDEFLVFASHAGEHAGEDAWHLMVARPKLGYRDRTKRAVRRQAIVFQLIGFDLSLEEIGAIQWRETDRNVFSPEQERRPPQKKETLPRSASVYFIRAETGGPIKIGWAFDPAKRRRELQNASPVPLVIVGTIQGGPAKESDLHKKFRHLRLHGEWFLSEPELLDFISTEAATWN